MHKDSDVINDIKEQEMAKPFQEKKRRTRKRLLAVAFILINIAVLAYALIGDIKNPEQFSFKLLGEMFSRNWYYLLLALISLALSVLLRAVVIYIMQRSITKNSSFLLCLSATILGKYYDSITPFGSGGQPFQIMYLSKHGIKKGEAISLPLAEYSLSRFSFILLSVAAIIFNIFNFFQTRTFITNTMMIAVIVGLTVSFIFPAFILLFSFSRAFCSKIIKFVISLMKFLRLTKSPEELYAKIMSQLEESTSSIEAIAAKKTVVAASFVLSFIANLSLCSIAYFVLKTFGYSLSPNLAFEWLHVVVLCLFVYNSVIFFPTPGNSGAADLSFYLLFYEALAGSAAIAMITWRIMSYYLFILAGLLVIIFNSFKIRRLAVLSQIRIPKEDETP